MPRGKRARFCRHCSTKWRGIGDGAAIGRRGGDQHQEVHLDLQLRVEIAETKHPFEVDLPDARRGEGKRHAEQLTR